MIFIQSRDLIFAEPPRSGEKLRQVVHQAALERGRNGQGRLARRAGLPGEPQDHRRAGDAARLAVDFHWLFAVLGGDRR